MRQALEGRIARTSSGRPNPRALAAREVLGISGEATKEHVRVGGVVTARRHYTERRREHCTEIYGGGLARRPPLIWDAIDVHAKVAVDVAVMRRCSPAPTVC